MDNTAKNKIDSCLKLAEYWASRHDRRREFEWKVALAWWGLLVLAVRYLHFSSLETITACQYVLLSGLLAFVLLLSFVRLWLYPLWKANMRDRDKSLAAAHSAADILRDADAKPNLLSNDEIDVSFKRFRNDWSMRFQIFTTAVLLIVLCISVRCSLFPQYV